MDRPCVHAKAFESRGLFIFALHVMDGLVASLQAGNHHKEPGQRLLAAASFLFKWYLLMIGTGQVMAPEFLRESTQHIVNHNTMMRTCGLTLAPKHHWAYELTRLQSRNGNAKFYSTAPDESYNKLLRGQVQSVNSGAYAVGVLKQYRIWCMVQRRDL